MMHHRRLRYVGLDVHRATIAVALAEEEGLPTEHGTIPNEPSSIRKLMMKLGGKAVELRVAYEAGPTGYALHRQLAKLGIECLVAAPSLIPVRPGDKVKTDRVTPSNWRDCCEVVISHLFGCPIRSMRRYGIWFAHGLMPKSMNCARNIA